MKEINTEKLPKIPQHHFNSLKKIEAGYWWYEGRIIWASKFIMNWLEKIILPILLTTLISDVVRAVLDWLLKINSIWKMWF